MIPQANITAWRAVAPWMDDGQVEQDLILSRAVVEVFSDPGLAGALALRGGTSLNKLHLRPQCRYSEDIDLVQTRAAPIGPILDAIRARLDSWLGKPHRKASGGNVTLTYRFDSEIAPIRPLRLKLEINTREHFTVMGYQSHPLRVNNPWFRGEARLTTYGLDELMGTKLRALYQRSKGRDLFDLWLCLERKLIEPERVINCFHRYMQHEGHAVTRAQFTRNLQDKQRDLAFMTDARPLLDANLRYDPALAMIIVQVALIERLEELPRGVTKRWS